VDDSTPLRERSSPVLPADVTGSSPVDEDSLVGRLRSIVEATPDLSSWSDQLAAQSSSWPVSYFLSPVRANILRGLPLPRHGAVLEIGARAGALTRALGEEYSLVDSLEPDEAMAGVAAARCADLRTVEVRLGWLDSVPAEPVYDLVVAADVLGELAQRRMSIEDFLTMCRARMAPGALLVLCADNADSVRHRSGALPPEAGIAAPVRPSSLTLDELRVAVTAAGLEVSTASAFPDHRHTQVLFDDAALTAVDPLLLEALPHFPSPPYAAPPVRPELEGTLWSSAVAAGKAHHHANSIVALISDSAPPSIAPATYWSLGRAAALSACNRIRVQDGVPVVDRQHAFPGAPPADGPLALHAHVEPYIRGQSLVAHISDAPNATVARELLREWVLLVEGFAPAAEVPWDLIPRNVIVDAAGALNPIDQEWALETATAASVVRRGVFWLVSDLVGTGPLPGWLRGRTHGEMADFLLRLSGQDAPVDWLATFVQEEGAATSFVGPLNPPRTHLQIERQNGRILSAISQSSPDAQRDGGDGQNNPVDSAALQDVVDSLLATNEELRRQLEELDRQRRHDALTQRDHAIGITAEMEVLRDRIGSAQSAQKLAMVKVRRLRKRVASMEASATWRIGRMVVGPLARLRGRR
jgi:hypothetical protein